MHRWTPFFSPIKHNLLALGVFLLVWAGASLFFPEDILPSPLTAAAHPGTFRHPQFMDHFQATLPRAAAGWGISLFLGTAVGAGAFALNIHEWLETFLLLFQVLPGLVLGIVFLMAFGEGSVVPVCLILCLTTPFIAVNTSNALIRRDPAIEHMIRSFGGGRRRLVRDLWIPSLVPAMKANTALGLVMSVKIVLLGEFLACDDGIGYLLNVSRLYSDMGSVFFYILVILILIVVCQILTAVVFGICFEKYLYPR